MCSSAFRQRALYENEVVMLEHLLTKYIRLQLAGCVLQSASAPKSVAHVTLRVEPAGGVMALGTGTAGPPKSTLGGADDCSNSRPAQVGGSAL